MELPQSNTLLPVCSYTRTELLSLRTKTYLLSLSTVDRLKDLNIGYHLPRRHRSSRGVKRSFTYPFISYTADKSVPQVVCAYDEVVCIYSMHVYIRKRHGV